MLSPELIINVTILNDKRQYFCIRFKNPEICKAFKDCFETSQKENEALQSGSDSATGAEAADEAATAIASLSTKEAAEA